MNHNERIQYLIREHGYVMSGGALTPENKEHLALAFGTVGSPTTEKAIIFNLALDQRQYTPKNAQKVFVIALGQGLIIENPAGEFSCNFDKAGEVIDKDLVNQAAKERDYQEQADKHEAEFLDEQAKQDEMDWIIAEIYNGIFYDIILGWQDD